PAGGGLDAAQPGDLRDLRLADRAVAHAVQVVDRLAGRVVTLPVLADLGAAGADLEGLRSLRRGAARPDRSGRRAGDRNGGAAPPAAAAGASSTPAGGGVGATPRPTPGGGPSAKKAPCRILRRSSRRR